MHWSTYSVTFARPIQWIVALFGQEAPEMRIRTVHSGKIHGAPVYESWWMEVKDLESHLKNLRHN